MEFALEDALLVAVHQCRAGTHFGAHVAEERRDPCCP